VNDARTGRMGHNVLLTGATGFLGSEIMKRILERHPEVRLTLLVRSTTRETAQERIEALVQRLLGPDGARACLGRVDVLNGDISLKGLGLDRDRTASLRSRVDHVIHCAATIRFDLPLEIARRDNTEGTRHVLSFAEGLERLGRFDYIGTAYVAGQREGLIKEDELDVGQQYSNSYERTKMEAETLVRDFARRHPTAIYRPSIVVGHSRTGETTSFQGFSHALTLYRRLYRKGMVFRGALLMLPADPDALIDIVPIDYVADALFAMMQTDRSLGSTFHLTSGPRHVCRFDDLMRMTAEFTGVPQPRYVSKAAWLYGIRPSLYTLVWGKRRGPMVAADKYFPYVWTKFSFDKTHTDAILEGTGIETPRPADYFVKLLEYQARKDPSARGADPG
jgi:thioester reductase-like protein